MGATHNMPNQLIETVEEQLDRGRPDDDADGREEIDNRERGCGHLKKNAAYVRTDVAALSAEGGEIPRFVEFDEPVEYREHTGKGAIIPGWKKFEGVSFTLHYQTDERTTTPEGDIDDHIERLRRYGFDGEHYGDITSARTTDLLMSVGTSNYETPDDYIDECRRRGLNLRIPVSDRNEPPVVEPLRTRVFIIHPHGCGDGRPGIIGYSYLTRTVFTTGSEATAEDPDVPRWAQDYADAGYMDIVDPGEPIPADEVDHAEERPGDLNKFEVGEVPAEVLKNKTTVVNVTNDGVECDEYIGRGEGGAHMLSTEPTNKGWLGNPYPVNDERSRREAVEAFAEDFGDKLDRDPKFRRAVDDLQGKTLGCYCSPELCHGDVIAHYLNYGSVQVPDEPTHDGEEWRDVVTVTLQRGEEVRGVELEFGRDDVNPDERAESFREALDAGMLNYNALKVAAGERDDIDVGATPKKEDLIAALAGDEAGIVPAYTDKGDE